MERPAMTPVDRGMKASGVTDKFLQKENGAVKVRMPEFLTKIAFRDAENIQFYVLKVLVLVISTFINRGDLGNWDLHKTRIVLDVAVHMISQFLRPRTGSAFAVC